MKIQLLNQPSISRFQFWMDGQMHLGMRSREGLFRHVADVDRTEWHQAFTLARSLAQTGAETAVTTAASHYEIWVNLRSQPTPAPSTQQIMSRSHRVSQISPPVLHLSGVEC